MESNTFTLIRETKKNTFIVDIEKISEKLDNIEDLIKRNGVTMPLVKFWIKHNNEYASLVYTYSNPLNIDKRVIDFFYNLKLSKNKRKSNFETEVIKAFKLYKEEQEVKKQNIEEATKFYNILQQTKENKITWRKLSSSKRGLILDETYISQSGSSLLKLKVTGKSDDGKYYSTHMCLYEKSKVINVPDPKMKSYKKLYYAIIGNINLLKQSNRSKGRPKYSKKNTTNIIKRTIRKEDFVVRTNVLKCLSENHPMEDIIGIISIVTSNGSIVVKEVPAAYCKECKCYFLLKDDYKQLAQKGVLLCNLIEKEEFYKYGLNHSIYLSKESILMRNGYNVKATLGLTDIQRQTILANIMDNQILYGLEIVNYLRWFISQKKNISSYKTAVDKWEADLQFVQLYRKDSRRKVFINSITKTEYKKFR